MRRRLLLAAAAIAMTAAHARAETPEEFYKGRTVKLVMSAGEGGGYGTYVNAIVPYMQRYIPGNPKIIVQHMQGAGGLVAANNMYNVQPRDGSVFALIHRAAVSTAALFEKKNIRFDPTRFGWIGSMNDEKSVCAVWHTAPVKTFEDLRTIPIPMSGLGPGGDTDVYTNLLNNVFGTRMKLVTGYHSGNDMDLAIERGEVAGRCGWSWSTIISTKSEWVADKKIVLLLQMALEKHPDLPDVPLVTDFATTDEQRQILDILLSPQLMGRPLLTPPEVPPERLDALRKAFVASMSDPQFVASAKAMNLEISMVPGERLETMIKHLFAMPEDIVRKAAAATENPNKQE
ncbi:MAG: Bug family tripartite tricarboxylate transporter substrate binding protein [Gemmatimonas sp.]